MPPLVIAVAGILCVHDHILISSLTRYLTSLLLVGISPNLQLGCSFEVRRSKVKVTVRSDMVI